MRPYARCGTLLADLILGTALLHTCPSSACNELWVCFRKPCQLASDASASPGHHCSLDIPADHAGGPQVMLRMLKISNTEDQERGSSPSPCHVLCSARHTEDVDIQGFPELPCSDSKMRSWPHLVAELAIRQQPTLPKM